VEPSVQIGYPLEKTFLIFSPQHAVHTHRSIAALLNLREAAASRTTSFDA
jgi:hypothetical protein